MDTPSDMAATLHEKGVDLSDDRAIECALIEANHKTSHINIFKDDAVRIARDMGDEEDKFFKEHFETKQRRAA